MGFLDKDWFKKTFFGEEPSEPIKEAFQEIIEGQNKKTEKESIEKYYRTLLFINNTLTVIFSDGSTIIKEDIDESVIKEIDKCSSKEAIVDLLTSKETKEEFFKRKSISEKILLLEESGEFELINESVYMKGINRSIPELLLDKFANIALSLKTNNSNTWREELVNSDQYKAHKRFWQKCCLNPNAKSAEDLYKFLNKHQFKIDKWGNFYAYRRVVSVDKPDSQKDLYEYVSNAYIKVKAWKKSPRRYSVYKTDENEYGITDNVATYGFQSKNNQVLGNLEDLYSKASSEKAGVSYTSAHTGKEDYRIGEIISMPRHYGDDDNSVSCSKGFHAASKEYDYSGFGDTPILMIINPMDVLAVPHGEVGKLRTCCWYFACVLDEEEKYILDDDDFNVQDLGDTFEEKYMADITKHVETAYAEEAQRHKFNVNYTYDRVAVEQICEDLSSIKEVIKKKVKIV